MSKHEDYYAYLPEFFEEPGIREACTKRDEKLAELNGNYLATANLLREHHNQYRGELWLTIKQLDEQHNKHMDYLREDHSHTTQTAHAEVISLLIPLIEKKLIAEKEAKEKAKEKNL